MTTSASPHAVLAASKESGPLHATLFGNNDPVASLRMAQIMVNGGWISVQLSEYGAKTLSHLGHFRAHDRLCYYIDHCEERQDGSTPMLSGYFLPEFEHQPKRLRLEKGLFNQVSFYDQEGNADERVLSYDFLTPQEKSMVQDCTHALFRATSAEICEADRRLKNFFCRVDEEAEHFRLLCLSLLDKEKTDAHDMKCHLLKYVAEIPAEQLEDMLMSLLMEAEAEAMRKRLTNQLMDCQQRMSHIIRLTTLLGA